MQKPESKVDRDRNNVGGRSTTTGEETILRVGPSLTPGGGDSVVLYIDMHVCVVGWSVVPCMIQGAMADSGGSKGAWYTDEVKY